MRFKITEEYKNAIHDWSTKNPYSRDNEKVNLIGYVAGSAKGGSNGPDC